MSRDLDQCFEYILLDAVWKTAPLKGDTMPYPPTDCRLSLFHDITSHPSTLECMPLSKMAKRQFSRTR